MLHKLTLCAVLALSAASAFGKCIPGKELFFVQTNPFVGDAVGRDHATYSATLKEIKLSAKPNLDFSHHPLFLYGGFWLATEDWCYDTDVNSIRLVNHLHHGISKAETAYGTEIWVGYSSPEDSASECVRGNVLDALPGQPWNSNDDTWERDGKKYQEIREGYFEYSSALEEIPLKEKPAPGTKLAVNATVAGLPTGTYPLDYCYDAKRNAIRLLHKPLRRAGYGALPGTGLKEKEYFFLLYNVER